MKTGGADLADAEVTDTQSRQVFDVPEPQLEVTDHEVETRRCLCGLIAYPYRIPTLVGYMSTTHICTPGCDNDGRSPRKEMAAAMLCGTAGIDTTTENSAAYIHGWLAALRNDRRLVVTAAAAAQRAADYILDVPAAAAEPQAA